MLLRVTPHIFTETSATYSTAVAAQLSLQKNLLLHEVKQVLTPHALLRPGCVGLAPCWVHQHVTHPCIVRGPGRMLHVQHSEQILAACMHIRLMYIRSTVSAHQVNAHQIDTHWVNAHQIDTHQVSAHQAYAHSVNAHLINAHHFRSMHIKSAHIRSMHIGSMHISSMHIRPMHIRPMHIRLIHIRSMHGRSMHIRSMHIPDLDSIHRHQQCHQHHHQQRVCVAPQCSSSLQYLSCRHQVVNGFRCLVIEAGSKQIPVASVGAARPSLPLVGLTKG